MKHIKFFPTRVCFAKDNHKALLESHGHVQVRALVWRDVAIGELGNTDKKVSNLGV